MERGCAVWEVHMPAHEALTGVGQRGSGKVMGWAAGWGQRLALP